MQNFIFILSIVLVIASAVAGIRGHRLSMKNSPQIDEARLEMYKAEESSRPSLQDVITKSWQKTFTRDTSAESQAKGPAS